MSGRSKKLSLNRYIWLCTRGLPKNTRLDTAAELRVHVLERIRMLEGQGFTRAEAEHVAVSEMGLPEPTNRAFLGHVFTYTLGWAVLGCAVLGLGLWWAKDNLFAKDSIVTHISLGTSELATLLTPHFKNLTDYNALKLIAPQHATGFEWTTFIDGYADKVNYTDLPISGQIDPEGHILPSNYRHEFTMLFGVSPSSAKCGGQLELKGLISPLLDHSILIQAQLSGWLIDSVCFGPKDGLGIQQPSSVFPRGSLALNKWETAMIIALPPEYKGCFPVDNQNHCPQRLELEKNIFKNISSHPDRYLTLAVRAVDAEHRLGSCVHFGDYKNTGKVADFGVNIEPPRDC